MDETQSTLLIEFLSWVAARRRTYDEAMEAWQSHCPRATIWEDAVIAGLVELETGSNDRDPDVVLTPQGRSILGKLDAP